MLRDCKKNWLIKIRKQMRLNQMLKIIESKSKQEENNYVNSKRRRQTI